MLLHGHVYESTARSEKVFHIALHSSLRNQTKQMHESRPQSDSLALAPTSLCQRSSLPFKKFIALVTTCLLTLSKTMLQYSKYSSYLEPGASNARALQNMVEHQYFKGLAMSPGLLQPCCTVNCNEEHVNNDYAHHRLPGLCEGLTCITTV